MIPKFSSRLITVTAAATLGYGVPASAQAVITGFEGFRWGTSRSQILRHFGTPVEDLKEAGRERISYLQGADSGYMFVFTPDHGLVAGIRILPLPSGHACAVAVTAQQKAMERRYSGLRAVDRKVPDPTGQSCGGLKEWTVIWRDGAGNQITLATEGGAQVSLPTGVKRHRLYIGYTSAGSSP